MQYTKTPFWVLFFISVSILWGCEQTPTYTPKPRAYPKIELPVQNYQPFDALYCDFDFEYPSHCKLIRDTLFFDEAPKHPCWFDLHSPTLNAYIHCSYIPISKTDPFDKLVADAFALTHKHNIKADYIDQLKIEKPNGVSGFAFDIEGSVASPFQFYLTDSTQHFLRGSLYIRDKARPDSLAPIYEFMKADIMHLINTFEWE